jgi:hypothetical protein
VFEPLISRENARWIDVRDRVEAQVLRGCWERASPYHSTADQDENGLLLGVGGTSLTWPPTTRQGPPSSRAHTRV